MFRMQNINHINIEQCQKQILKTDFLQVKTNYLFTLKEYSPFIN